MQKTFTKAEKAKLTQKHQFFLDAKAHLDEFVAFLYEQYEVKQNAWTIMQDGSGFMEIPKAPKPLKGTPVHEKKN